MVDYQTALNFLIGISAIAVEPIVARLEVRLHDYAKYITLALVIIATWFGLSEIPDALKAVDMPQILFLIPFGVLLWRLIWQFNREFRNMQNLSLSYLVLFVIGLAVFGGVFYIFMTMSILDLTRPEGL